MPSPRQQLSPLELGFIALSWIPPAVFLLAWWSGSRHRSGLGISTEWFVLAGSMLAMLVFGVVGLVATCARIRERQPAAALGIASLVSAGPLILYFVAEILSR